MLALATGPAWVLVRRIGLDGWLAALATLTVTLPALVYGYELIASVKEITALPMILTLGALVVLHPRWLRGPPLRCRPVRARGRRRHLGARDRVRRVGAHGGDRARGDPRSAQRRRPDAQRAPRRRCALGRRTRVPLVAAASPPCAPGLDLSGSLQVAKNIASTTNPGNLQTRSAPSRSSASGWSTATSTSPPAAISRSPTRSPSSRWPPPCSAPCTSCYLRAYALAAWIALTLAVWLGLTAYGTTWADGKALMLTSPVVVLLAWSGVAALRAFARLPAGRCGDARARRRCCWRSRSPAASPRPTRCSTTAPTSRPPRATKSSLRSTRASPGGDRRCSPTTTNTRSTCCATSTSAARASCTRPASIAQTEGQPADLDRVSPGRPALLPADRHPPRPRRRAPAGRLPPAVPGRLLRGLGPPARRARGARPPRLGTRRRARRATFATARCGEHAFRSVLARRRPGATGPSARRAARSARARREIVRDRRRARLASGLDASLASGS